jgi:putative lipoic acid-binding regulatory protein
VQDNLPEEVKQVIQRCAPKPVARVDYKESSKF